MVAGNDLDGMVGDRKNGKKDTGHTARGNWRPCSDPSSNRSHQDAIP